MFGKSEQKKRNKELKKRAGHLSERSACGLHCIKMEDIGVYAGKTPIIEHVNVHIHCGKLTAVIGRNGAGKSTLIKAILGEMEHEGTIEFRDMKENKVKKLKIGYVPQHLNVKKDAPVSVYDLFASCISNVPVFLCRKKALYDKIVSRLALFEAENLIDKRLGDLSGGELQRVLLAIACTPVPNLLLLDEPVSGVDRKGMELFYRTIHNLKEKYDLSVILVSHDLTLVKEYADSVILLDKTVLKEGRPEEVMESDEFHEIFG